MFDWGGELFWKYGWSGTQLAGFGAGIGYVAELRAGDAGVRTFAVKRLRETGGAAAIGLVLRGIAAPLQGAGNYLADTQTQCRVGEALSFGSIEGRSGDQFRTGGGKKTGGAQRGSAQG